MLSINSDALLAWAGAFLWPFIRILALVGTAPVLSHRAIAPQVKIGLALAIAIVVAPTLPPPPAAAFTSWNGFGVLAQQVAVGAAMGFMLRLMFAAIELAGDLMGLSMGLSFATFVDPQNSDQTPLIGSYLGVLASLVFLAINGHLIVVNGIVESFRAFPVGSMPSTGAGTLRDFALMGGEIFRVGVHLALPVIAALLVVNLAIGVMTRAAPQLNLMSFGFPVGLLAGLWMLWIATPWTVAAIERHLERSLVFLMR
ncbi:MAG: flagellar biosynthetic protein FliR [Burkholderiales bacterium]|nr:flagellar biosynthetic protein FliR [Burkholderiales bacterium]